MAFPQGSNLGPLLFNIFINEIPVGISSHVLLYADDLRICLKVNSIHERDMLQHDVYLSLEWVRINRVPRRQASFLTARKFLVSSTIIFCNSLFLLELMVSWFWVLIWTLNFFSQSKSQMLLPVPDDIWALYNGLVHPILEYYSVEWSYDRMYSTDRNEAVQGKFCSILVYKGLLLLCLMKRFAII